MLPVIALVGRPNVGKSTLFNRLTRSRDALVADYAGLTRDRIYGQGKVGSQPFIVIDTGGISGFEQGIDVKMAEQSFAAVDEADAVLFITDAQQGVTPTDKELANFLRQKRKPLFLVVNKIDGFNQETVVGEFYELGLTDPLAIAAAHNRGVAALVDEVMETLQPAPIPDQPVADTDQAEPPVLDDQAAEQTDSALPESMVHIAETTMEPTAGQDQPSSLSGDFQAVLSKGIKIAVIGRPNVGKSTLVNRMLGEDRVVVYDQSGTTRDSVYIPYQRFGEDYTIIDTAGVRRRKNVKETIEKFSIIKTLQAIEDAHVCIFLLDAKQGIAEQDLHLLGFILDAGRSLVVAVNKWDGQTETDKAEFKAQLHRRLDFLDFADLHYISALHGTGVGHLYESVHQAYDSSMAKWSTNFLTQILQDAVQEHQPPVTSGHRIKLRYAHQGGSNPPIIVVHGNQTQRLPGSYKRYLQNIFRKVLKVKGTNLRFEFKTSENPYAGKTKKPTHEHRGRSLRMKKIIKSEYQKRKRKKR